jgi:hypothetical protein
MDIRPLDPIASTALVAVLIVLVLLLTANDAW